jgi:hypothetical protein
MLQCVICKINKKEVRILRKMRVKEKVIKMIEELPEDVTVSDIMAELYFRQNVDEGLKELDEGKGINHEEAKKRLLPGDFAEQNCERM